jgi:hypothetical protein
MVFVMSVPASPPAPELPELPEVLVEPAPLEPPVELPAPPLEEPLFPLLPLEPPVELPATPLEDPVLLLLPEDAPLVPELVPDGPVAPSPQPAKAITAASTHTVRIASPVPSGPEA